MSESMLVLAKLGSEVPHFLHGRLRYLCYTIYIMNLFPCPSGFLEATHMTWLMVLSSLTPATNESRPSHITSLWPLLPPSSTIKDPCDFMEPTGSGESPHSKVLHLITSAKFPWPCKVTYSQVPEIRSWTFEGRDFSASHILFLVWVVFAFFLNYLTSLLFM